MSSFSKHNRSSKESFSAISDDIDVTWNELLSSIERKETAVSRFIWKIVTESKGNIKSSDIIQGTGLDRRGFSQILNGKWKPEQAAIVALSASDAFSADQKKEILTICNREHICSLLDIFKTKNIKLKGRRISEHRDSRNAVVREHGLISSAEFSKIKKGCLCNFTTAMKLCFGLHCSVAQSEELLKAYGFCWQEDETSFFLKQELANGCFDAFDVLEAWWEHRRGRTEVA